MDYTQVFTTGLEIAGGAIVGGLAVYGLFDKTRRERQKDDDQTASNLINNLKTALDLQEKTIAQMRADMDQHTKERNAEMTELRDKVSHLTGRNQVLEDLFKGRDPAMQGFLKEAPMLMTIARENNGLAKENSDALKNLTDAITELVKELKVHDELQA